MGPQKAQIALAPASAVYALACAFAAHGRLNMIN
jgi:hypothetical protein